MTKEFLALDVYAITQSSKNFYIHLVPSLRIEKLKADVRYITKILLEHTEISAARRRWLEEMVTIATMEIHLRGEEIDS